MSTLRTEPGVWEKLAAPLARGDIQWRIDGKPGQRDGKWFARVVAYADVPVVVARLDAVVPGEWDVIGTTFDRVGEECAIKARITVLGVHREDVGMGPDPKQAMTDAIKRAARLFGIGLELWTMGPVWVQVDSDSKYAKMIEDPWSAFDRQQGAATAPLKVTATVPMGAGAANGSGPVRRSVLPTPAPAGGDDQPCPKCGGKTWDNRATKKNPKQPDYKCRDKQCDGVIWPPRVAKPATVPDENDGWDPSALVNTDDDSLPF